MKRLTCLILLLAASDVYACSRCGLFGFRCKFSSHRKAVPVVRAVPQNNVTTIVNIAPPQAYGQQYTPGSLSSYPLVKPVDGTEYLHLQREIQELALETAKTANQGTNQFMLGVMQLQAANNSSALKVEQIRAGADHMRATLGLKENVPQNFSLEIRDGKVTKLQNLEVKQQAGNLFNLAPRPPTANNAPAAQPSPQGQTALQLRCIVCHGGESPSGGISFAGDITEELRRKATWAMRLRSGEVDADFLKALGLDALKPMPPNEKPALSSAEILQVSGELETKVK